MSHSSSMIEVHQNGAPFGWTLGPAQALTLAAAAQPRGLWVHEGRVWLTRGRGSAPAEDFWLEAGQGLALEAGSHWVAEAWPQARLSVLEAPPQPPRPVRPGLFVRVGAWLGALLPRPQAASVCA
ncbi:hypothetical protein RA210_U50150 [Rubrivivax sp. A210]|uniref:DUF2917 domain-containing protein n=1 Tax=Rubrivivax sp. A210 TaxID=2772301 RepID=UPI00191AA804|nr:DUF2917 domain-containing protein [Rubrivivax sp. A210]CAD5374199.1 hypothetical protein RA210_U50150 [Rubrivivax sp. A210]